MVKSKPILVKLIDFVSSYVISQVKVLQFCISKRSLNGALPTVFPKAFCRASDIDLSAINVHLSLLTGPLPTIWCGGWFIPEFQTSADAFSIGG